MNTEIFGIAPTTSRAIWLLALVPVLVLVITTAVVGPALLGARSAQFEVSSEGLRLRGDLYGRTIATEHLRVSDIRRLDLRATPELRPRWRTMGT
jgi:hypothetical protein